MRKAFYIAVAAVLAASPLILAHAPMGTPKTYCESGWDWQVHEYIPVASGNFAFTPTDGNLQSCGLPPGVDADVSDPNPANWRFEVILGVADYDGHLETAQGGAVLPVDSGLGGPSPSANLPAGSLYCFAQEGHHPTFGPFNVDDIVFGTGVAFTVGVDRVDVGGAGGGCGDGIIDNWVAFPGGTCPCYVPFGPGLDGVYSVFVGPGTAGHVSTL